MEFTSEFFNQNADNANPSSESYSIGTDDSAICMEVSEQAWPMPEDEQLAFRCEYTAGPCPQGVTYDQCTRAYGDSPYSNAGGKSPPMAYHLHNRRSLTGLFLSREGTPSFTTANTTRKKAKTGPDLTSSSVERVLNEAPFNRDPTYPIFSLTEGAGSDNSPSAESSPCSSTDYPDGESQEELITPMLDPIKQQLIARVMADFYTMFNSSLPPPTDVQTQTLQASLPLHESCRSSTLEASNVLNIADNEKHTSSPDPGSWPPKGKRSLPPDDDDINDAKKRRTTPSQVAVESNGIKYACHFHQDDPQRFSCNNRT